MRVYYPGERKNHQMFVAPGADPRVIREGVNAEWLDSRGAPRTFTIDFVNGVAEVADALGRYLIATGQARRTGLWLPPSFVDRAA